MGFWMLGLEATEFTDLIFLPMADPGNSSFYRLLARAKDISKASPKTCAVRRSRPDY